MRQQRNNVSDGEVRGVSATGASYRGWGGEGVSGPPRFWDSYFHVNLNCNHKCDLNDCDYCNNITLRLVFNSK